MTDVYAGILTVHCYNTYFLPLSSSYPLGSPYLDSFCEVIFLYGQNLVDC